MRAIRAMLMVALAAGAGAAGSAAPAWAQAVRDEAPPIPVEEIIRRFAEQESQFKIERGNYAYNQSVVVEESAPGGPRGGRYEMVSDIIFTPEGRRYEQIRYAPPSTLRMISLSPEDMRDLENIQPFVLTTEELPKYNVEYVGREKVDELDTYVFRVSPKRIEKNQRYFEGTIWVEEHDLAIVKSDGKAVPDIVERGRENRFPRFVTYRENIEKNFWFPTYTRADDTLQFSTGAVRIRMTVRYRDYKRFGSTIRLGESRPVETPPEESEPAREPVPQPSPRR